MFILLILVVLLHLEKRLPISVLRVVAIRTVVSAAAGVIIFALELVDLIFHAGHLCVLILLILVVLLHLEKRVPISDLRVVAIRTVVSAAAAVIVFALELVDLIFHS